MLMNGILVLAALGALGACFGLGSFFLPGLLVAAAPALCRALAGPGSAGLPVPGAVVSAHLPGSAGGSRQQKQTGGCSISTKSWP